MNLIIIKMKKNIPMILNDIDATWRTLHIINRVHCNQFINKNAYSLIFNNKNSYTNV